MWKWLKSQSEELKSPITEKIDAWLFRSEEELHFWERVE